MFKDICLNNNYKTLINGDWVNLTEDKIQIFSPIDFSNIGSIPSLKKEQVDIVIESSIEGKNIWRTFPLSKRADVLYRASELLLKEKEYLSRVLQLEIGKDKLSSLSEIDRTAEFIKYTADCGRNLEEEAIKGESYASYSKSKYSYISRVPVGIVLAISPFNYPINLSASKIAPALIGGNSVILKPPSQGTIAALHLCDIFKEAGLPNGVLNTVTGKSSEIGDYLVTNEHINFINFTGSTKVGTHIAKIAGMVPMLLELGGKDAAIVLEDADLDKTAEEITKGAFNYSGQRCTAVKRVLAMKTIEKDLTEKIKALTLKLTVGSPFDDCLITPLIDNEAADFVEGLVKDALTKGAKEILPFKRIKNLIYPTILTNVSKDMKIAWEEPFGPVLPIISIDSKDEAIAIANDSKYGLQSSVFTGNIDDAFYLANSLEVGTVQINGKTERGPDNFPFTGVKASGLGTQGIKYSIEAMTRIKNIVVNTKYYNPGI